MVKNTLLQKLGEMEKINEMYNYQNRTQKEIADVLGCSKSTISRKMKKFGIESSYNGSLHPCFFSSDGYSSCTARTSEGRKQFYIHRLAAYAHFDGSFEEFRKREIHHRTKYKFDNRPENLEPVSEQQHKEIHNTEEWVEDNGWTVLRTPEGGE